MDFSAREDIEAPIDFVFEHVTDFSAFERSIMRRGGDVERLHGGDAPVVGTKWKVKFRLRGKERSVDAAITEVDAPNRLRIDVTSRNADGAMTVELVALSPKRTRVIVWADAGAKTIPAKLFFQSIRLARAKTDTKFKSLVAGFAEDVEARYQG